MPCTLDAGVTCSARSPSCLARPPTARLAATLRHEDTLARLAGDEFVLVCEQLPRHTDDELDAQLHAVTARLHTTLAHPIRVGAVDLVVSASIGVALSSSGSTGDDLLAQADAAMYRAKQRRHHDLVIRHHDRSRPHGDARHLERELAQALPRAQLRVHYQPIVNYPDEGRERALRFALDLVDGPETLSVNAACKRGGEQLPSCPTRRAPGPAGPRRRRQGVGLDHR